MSDSFDSVLVSTDDDEIADVARAAGAEVPFLRSPRTLSVGGLPRLSHRHCRSAAFSEDSGLSLWQGIHYAV
ncbi:CMP-2-keto-3-deoxyoctulosonic acid synthetase [Rhizobium sp. BK226]|nr:CMP-2-keto-3-deoxyoctulosonic acid synthetase [Rhizobium sp. BK226]